jgi:hypothetical protein
MARSASEYHSRASRRTSIGAHRGQTKEHSLTTEQLNQARADVWHQGGHPLLTADEAAAWLRETGICLFLPRAQQLPTAAPSFVEAVLGTPGPTPAPDAIARAWELLHRLLSSGDAVALNLLGNTGLGLAGEQPDFLATTETLPFLFALRGDKEWKRGPRGKSSPLTIEVWKLLDREGPLTAEEVKDKLGRQLTEAAALRALGELWSHLRIEPVFTPGKPTGWQLLERRWAREMQAGSTVSQAVALSALVSLYLQSAVASSGEEIEVFLSPLASRSKVREVVRGLTTTRQLSTLNLGPVEMFHIAGGLPEFPEVAHAEGAVIEPLLEEGMGEGRRRFVANRPAATARASEPSPSSEKHGRPPRPERRPFAPKTGSTGEQRRPYGTRKPGADSTFHAREPWKEDAKFSSARAGESSEQQSSTPPQAPGRRPFAARESSGGERKPFTPREGGERKSFSPRSSDRPFKPRNEGKPFGERKSFTPRGDGDRKPFTPREGGERKSFAPRSGDRPFKPRSEGKPFGERKSFGERKPFTPREGGERKSFAPRSGDRPFKPRSEGKPFGERKSFTPRGDGDRKPFTPREGATRKPFTPGDRPAKPPFGARPASKPFGAGATRRPAGRPGASSTGPGRARTSPFTSSGKPRTGTRPPAGRTGSRPTGRSSGRPGVKRITRPRKGPGK